MFCFNKHTVVAVGLSTAIMFGVVLGLETRRNDTGWLGLLCVNQIVELGTVIKKSTKRLYWNKLSVLL